VKTKIKSLEPTPEVIHIPKKIQEDINER